MPEKTWVEVDFLDRWYTDRDAGIVRELSDYLALYPGHEEEIGRAFHDLDSGSTVGPVTAGGDGSSSLTRHLGPYVLLRELGRGGQAIVYCAEDTRLKRRVALKILSGRGPLSSEALSRFQREAEITSRLNHPNICAIYEAGTIDGLSYIAMRFEDGESLATRLSGTGGSHKLSTFPEARVAPMEGTEPVHRIGDFVRSKAELHVVLSCFETIARALHAAHEQGVIHRDIKPGNILITEDGRPVILDFGLARTTDGTEATLTRAGEFFGTPSYMAPEQIQNASSGLDRRADVWALGVTLYEVLTGTRPFTAPTRELLVQSILHRDPDDPRRKNPLVSGDLAVVLQTAIEKDLSRRYATAEAFADELLALREDRPISARPVGLFGRLLRWSRREPFRAKVAVALLILMPLFVVLGLDWVSTRNDAERGRMEAQRERYETAVEEAYFALLDGDLALAERLFLSADQAKKSEPEVLAGLVLVSWARRDRETILKLFSEYEPVIGRLSALSGLWNAARDGTEESLEKFLGIKALPQPVDAADCMLSGSRLLVHGLAGSKEHAARAVALFVEAIMRSPKARLLHHVLLAHAACTAGEVATALAEARVLRERWPDDSTALFWQGRCLLTSGDLEGAARAFDLAIAAKSSSVTAKSYRGKTAMRAADPQLAERIFRELVETGPEDFHHRNNLALSLRQLGRLEEAEHVLSETMTKHPREAGGWMNLGIFRVELGDLDGALLAGEQMVVVNPELPGAFVELGLIRSSRGDVELALEAFREAVRRWPSSADARLQLGMALVMKSFADEAITELRAVLQIDLSRQPAKAYLGRALMQKGRFREALSLLDDALSNCHSIEPWVDRANSWRSDCSRLALRESKAAERLALGKPSTSVEDLTAEALVLSQERRFAEAVATWLRLDMMPKAPSSNPADSSHWRAAATALDAAQATEGDDQESREARGCFRAQALRWLRIELDLFTQLIEREAQRTYLARMVVQYRTASEFASVRGSEALARLDPAEREEWTSFWKDFDAFAAHFQD